MKSAALIGTKEDETVNISNVQIPARRKTAKGS